MFKKNKKLASMLIDLGVYSRYEVLLENYCKTIYLEAQTVHKMANNQIYPAAISYLHKLSQTVNNLNSIEVKCSYLLEDVKELSELLAKMKFLINNLRFDIDYAHQINNIYEKAKVLRDKVIPSMNKLREVVDIVETKVDSNYWPMPTYVDLLFRVK